MQIIVIIPKGKEGYTLHTENPLTPKYVKSFGVGDVIGHDKNGNYVTYKVRANSCQKIIHGKIYYWDGLLEI